MLNEFIILLPDMLIIVWSGSFIAGFLLHDLKDSISLKYESFSVIIKERHWENYLQLILYYILQMVVICFIFPVKISNWIAWKTRIKK